MKVLDIIERDGLRERAGSVGAVLQQALQARKDSCAGIGDIRGCGLFIGVEMVADRARKTPDRDAAIDVVNRLKDNGFLTSNAGVFGNVVKIRPPLVFTQQHANEFLKAFDAAFTRR